LPEVDSFVLAMNGTLLPDPQRYPEELWGIEDPRITFVEELDRYVVAYTAFSRGGPGVALALTDDFHHFERLGLGSRGIVATAHRDSPRVG
jgi:predicted GH43/DUF377 family glycosyl hydrolase